MRLRPQTRPTAPADPTGATRCDARLRPGFTVRPHVLTWSACVFAVHAVGQAEPNGFVAVTGDELPGFLTDLDAGALDARLGAELGRPSRSALRRIPVAPDRPVAVGVEQELRVVVDGRPVDFRSIVHDLGIDGVRADPTDPNAYRCAWGGVITSDAEEAELATPPIPVDPGFVDRVTASLRAGHEALCAALPRDHELVGFSTHLNVSVGRRRDVAFARRYARTFAPALMLTLDRADSPGLLVRPRPGRLELGGEYAEGPALRAAIAFAAGSVLALDRAPVVRSRHASRCASNGRASGSGSTSTAPRRARTSTQPAGRRRSSAATGRRPRASTSPSAGALRGPRSHHTRTPTTSSRWIGWPPASSRFPPRRLSPWSRRRRTRARRPDSRCPGPGAASRRREATDDPARALEPVLGHVADAAQ